ncbi:hypothetical protein HZA38_04415 [Candidatus Peregrinibacteria bacterium]|nr:hypothetical protein [Candidatus Peregrinibacteria bacterium]
MGNPEKKTYLQKRFENLERQAEAIERVYLAIEKIVSKTREATNQLKKDWRMYMELRKKVPSDCRLVLLEEFLSDRDSLEERYLKTKQTESAVESRWINPKKKDDDGSKQ